MKRWMMFGICLFTLAASASAQQGWQGKPETAPNESEIHQLPPEQQERYDLTAKRIVEVLNARDADGLRALFDEQGWNDAIDWWKDLFAVQYEKFGSIAKAWAPRRGVVRTGKMGVRGDERDGASFLVHFEEPCGAVLSFELDDAGKIVHSSVWLHQSLGQVEPDEVPLIFGD